MTTSCQLASLDMAGTTIDEGGLVYRVLDDTVSRAVDAPVPAELLARWKGTSKREAVAGLLAGLGDTATPERVDVVFDEFVQQLISTYEQTPPAPLPGIPEALARLRSEGVKVALQTGYSAPIAEAILTGLGWKVGPGEDAVVDAVVTSDQVSASRPAPYLVFRTMEATGVQDVRRVLVAGDTPNDLGAGTGAGARWVVGVLSGSFGRDELSAEPHTDLLPSVADVPDLVLG